MPPEANDHAEPPRTGDEPVPTDTSPRASDAERGQAIDRLRTAYVEGRLDQEEFDERSRAALTARTQAQLARLFTDLPPGTAPTASTALLALRPVRPGEDPGPRLSLAIMSGVERRGHWRIPADSTAVAFMGGVCLDLRGAVLSARVTSITAVAFMGGVEIIVPPGIRVDMHGFGIMGGWDNRADQNQDLPLDTPVVRVNGFAFMGGVEVRTRRPKPPG
ncbi:MAG TPA: DUF1707 domain-containing protein [Actinomycetes bacterium]|jgi:hypothetical protein|nr:DUF1707 domain-containing protein [Actinomycetes bacterium]